MELTIEQIESLKIIYKQKFGIELSDKDALDIGIRIITLMKDMILPPNIEEICEK